MIGASMTGHFLLGYQFMGTAASCVLSNVWVLLWQFVQRLDQLCGGMSWNSVYAVTLAEAQCSRLTTLLPLLLLLLLM